MSITTSVDDPEGRDNPVTARPLLLGALAALSVGAAAIHFAVTFEHFGDDSVYGAFFLVLAWAQLLWPVVLIALPFLSQVRAGERPTEERSASGPSRWLPSGLTPLAARRTAVWLWLGIVGNVGVLAVYFSSRSVGLPIGPDTTTVESWGGLDVVCAIEEILLVVIAAAVLRRPGLLARPVRFRSPARSLGGLLAVPVAVLAATTAVMTPAWAGSEGPGGMDSASSMTPSAGSGATPGASSGSSASMPAGMGDMGTIDGQPIMKMFGDTNPPSAEQVQAAADLIKQTDASLVRYEDVNAALAAGYTERLETNGEEHLLYAGDDAAYQGLDPQHPSSLVYAINQPGHAPILLGAMYMMPDGVNGPQVGGGLTEWHSHLRICQGGKVVIAGFDVVLGGHCDPSTWKDKYTTQMLHVWVVPYSGGVFSDDLSVGATTAAAQAALAETKPGQLAP